ncbi:V-type ATP synthase subunit D [Pyrodictium occultum]|nr:V-type ATP synthase subunit D [Pyrodictium occultum]
MTFGGASRVLPTKINLINLRRELKNLRRIRRVVEEKRDVILLYIRQLGQEYRREYEKVAEALADAYRSFFLALMTSGGLEEVKPVLESVPSSMEVDVAARVLFAVKTPSYRLRGDTVPPLPVSAARLSPSLIRARERLLEVFQSLLKVVETEAAIQRLLEELRETQRLLNALDYSIIPSYEQNIKYIKLVLDDRMREEVIRLKTLKKRLARSRGGEGLA